MGCDNLVVSRMIYFGDFVFVWQVNAVLIGSIFEIGQFERFYSFQVRKEPELSSGSDSGSENSFKPNGSNIFVFSANITLS